ncbi:hypothetical protein [Calothrix sp. 336/3]|uniref:hypothetical protein n=1 Tax=Calothrix sp. 336/3 TaxID=1337936 RepID=UPI0004E37B87|nr:hypothetical protein [Calothrix sp. 336/3]AKG22332.1 hypothetical protein IJ00_14610 [Calothrix sp. 336/3]
MQSNTHKQTSQIVEVNARSHNTDLSLYSVIGYSILSLPILLLLGIATYKKYRVVTLRKQIAMLERIWMMDIKKNTYNQD